MEMKGVPPVQRKWFLVLALGVLLSPPPMGAQGVGEYEPAGAGLPLFRPPGALAVMAEATETWRAVPTDPHDLLGMYSFLPSHATDDTQGQLFRVLESEEGVGTDTLMEFVGVPWTIGCGCADEGWDGTEWVEPGDTVVFLLSPTRARVPWDGPPVFDVLGWHNPYPSGEFIPYWRHTRAEPANWLSKEEFFSLLQILPSEQAFRLDPTASVLAVSQWLEDHPGRENAFPVPTILWELERIAGGG